MNNSIIPLESFRFSIGQVAKILGVKTYKITNMSKSNEPYCDLVNLMEMTPATYISGNKSSSKSISYDKLMKWYENHQTYTFDKSMVDNIYTNYTKNFIRVSNEQSMEERIIALETEINKLKEIIKTNNKHMDKMLEILGGIINTGCNMELEVKEIKRRLKMH